MKILGVSAFYHDAAACVLVDGRLIAASEEERYSRVKHDSSLPTGAIKFCLDAAGLTIADIDRVAFYESPRKALSRKIWMTINAPFGSDAQNILIERLRDVEKVERNLRNGIGWSGPIEYVGHHEAHAASAFFYSGFTESAVLTVDGVGEWDTTTYGYGTSGGIDLFERVSFPHSLGLFYSMITAYLGFEVNGGEYKVMGLAPYGTPRYLRQLRKLIRSEKEGQYRLNLKYFDFLGYERMFSDLFIELMGRAPRIPESKIESFHADVARSLQIVLEDLLYEKVRYLHDKLGCKNLCMAGGVALNCVANGKILQSGQFKRLFVQPAAGDAGGALGAAAHVFVRETGGRKPVMALQHVYLGDWYSSDEIEELLKQTEVQYTRLEDDQALVDTVVDRLIKGDIIGWFQGRMEFGPRALGGRSIIADPRDSNMRCRINELVKKREAFRPFAPAVLEELAEDHFQLDHPARFMLEVWPVRSRLDLPAVTHVDGSARVQTVNDKYSPRFGLLLRRFNERTGCPIVLNTSFNVRGQPIVRTPIDALSTFVEANLDILVLENIIIDRFGIPHLWNKLIQNIARNRGQKVFRSRIRNDVYTLL